MKILFLVIIMTSGVFANISHSDSTESIEQHPKYSLGSVIGGFGLINPKFVAQNIFDRYEFQIMAGYGFGGKYVAETDLNYLLYSSDDFSHSIGIGIGTRNDYKKDHKSFFRDFGGLDLYNTDKTSSVYGKLNYSLNWHFLFLQTGLALGNNNYAAPKFTMQLGLLYHFR